jgi:hypothetical protein
VSILNIKFFLSIEGVCSNADARSKYKVAALQVICLKPYIHFTGKTKERFACCIHKETEDYVHFTGARCSMGGMLI